MKKKSLHIITWFLLSVLLCVSVLTGCSSGNTQAAATPTATPTSEVSAIPSEPATEPEPTEPETEYIEPVTVSLVAVGDMLMHTSASNPALMSDGSYNYDYLFANVKDIISAADIAVVNNEVIMAGNDKGNI